MTGYYLFPIYLIITGILLYLLLRLNKKYIKLIDKNIELKDVLSTSSCSIIISDNNNRIVKTINIKDDIFNDLDKNNFIIDFYRKVSEGDSKYKSINNHIILNTRNLYTPGMDSQNEFEICHNGKSKWINLKSVRIDGNRIISYLKDNTFDVETNKKIISSKSFLQAILDNIQVGVFVKDAENDFRYLFINEKMTSVFKMPNDVIGKNDYEINAENKDFFHNQDIRVAKYDIDERHELISYDENDEPVEWLLTTKKKLVIDDKCYILAVEKDLSELKRKEYEYKKIQKELSIAIDAGNIMVWSYNVKSLTFNKIHTKSDSDDNFLYFRNKSIDEVTKNIFDDDRDKLHLFINSLSLGAEINKSVILRFIVNNKIVYAEIYASSVINENTGEIESIIGTAKNITETIKQNEEMTALKEKAENSNKQKSAFLANMSHEIRSPLNAIVGFSNLIVNARTDAEKKEYVKFVNSNSEILLRLIDDILDISKIEAGNIDFKVTEWDLNDMFNDLFRLFEVRMNDNIKFGYSIPERKTIVKCDRNRMIQVISNLLSNAIKYTSEGEIKFGYHIRKKDIYFYVSDTGKGINKDDHDHVFGRFSKFDKSVSGNGIGLSICKMIIEKMNGKIGFSSDKSYGSTFFFSLPAEIIAHPLEKNKDMDDVSDCCDTPVRNVSGKDIINKKINVSKNLSDKSEPLKNEFNKTILIAEDNESNYILLKCMLRKNYNLIRATNGIEAINIFNSQKPDIILMDIRMPLMNGLDATLKIRETNKNIPIIALTAHAFDEDKRLAFDAGCNDFLTKPVNLNNLNKLLNSYN